ncbi:MAG: hypothetical protein ACLGIF_05600 [Actinomycetes bacterium]
MARDRRLIAAYVGGGVALVLMLVMLPFFVASGLMAPGWAVALLLLIWTSLFVTGLFWIRHRPLWVLPIPLAAAGIWFGIMWAGGELLGWTP